MLEVVADHSLFFGKRPDETFPDEIIAPLMSRRRTHGHLPYGTGGDGRMMAPRPWRLRPEPSYLRN